MKVLSLCDGLGGSKLAFHTLGIDVEYHAVEIDSHARRLADHNFPFEIIRWSDNVLEITEDQIKEYGPYDWITFGSPCFVAGTKVLTETGYKNIEDIKVGERVLTHTGTFKKVLRVGGKFSPTRRLKVSGHGELLTTDEHPFLSITSKRINIKVNGKSTSARTFSEEAWVEAKDLKKTTSFVKHASVKCSGHNPRNFTKEDCWIIGRFIADGHIRKALRTEKGRENDYQYQLILSIGDRKLDALKDRITERNYSCYPHSESVHKVVFSSKELVDTLLDMGFENGADRKKIPVEIHNLPVDLKIELLEGYMSGDGSYSVSTGEYKCNSVSEELILGLQLLVRDCYSTKASYSFSKKPPTCVIQGRTVNQKDTHSLTFKKEIPKQANYVLKNDEIYTPVRDNQLTGKTEYVYNLEVEEDNTYTVNNIVAHNCQSVSPAGKGEGLDGKSGLLIKCLQVLDWCRKYNPDVKFLIENVKMKEGFLEEFNFLIGETPILINSQLVSAQKRERYYWTNFPVTIPEDTNEKLIDILEDSVDENLYFVPKNFEKVIESRIIWDTKSKNNINSSKENIHQLVDKEKAFCIDANYSKGTTLRQYINNNRRQIVFAYSSSSRPNGVKEHRSNVGGKSNCLTTGDGCSGGLKSATMIADMLDDVIYFRRLTVRECARLQKIPDWYDFSVVSKTQAYKAIGNGWTNSVIAHIISCGIDDSWREL